MWICYFCNLDVDDSYKRCPSCGRDEEGYTMEERMRRRPTREIYGAVTRPKEARLSRKQIRNPFRDMVVAGTVRTSRDIFTTVYKSKGGRR